MFCAVHASHTFIVAVTNAIHHLYKCCSISDPLFGKGSALEQDEFWTSVAPGDTVPFSFEGRGEQTLA